jgi:hypothetical protein
MNMMYLLGKNTNAKQLEMTWLTSKLHYNILCKYQPYYAIDVSMRYYANIKTECNFRLYIGIIKLYKNKKMVMMI